MAPHGARQGDERRLTALKVGAVGLTVAGIGAFAGLAAAGTDDGPATAPAASTPAPDQGASDAARIAEDGTFFDDEAQGGAVGGYEDHRGDDDGSGDRDDDWGDHDGDRYSAPDGNGQGQGYAPSPGYAPSQGSTGGS